ncbi:MAG: FAD-dependent oxidoreductase [Gammaproteobacteria bacterium]|nr:FAD-dependent oxidoreductase [Gammaproteobacteria bacterium]MDH3534572.1 FAD-dependent oxidoreductase [Gammaproteobacteria bacterium]
MASERRNVVIIGGGAIGLSVAYHLGHLGIDDVLLLERDRLTSGTSWHAAGIVGPLRASMNLTRLARYALELFAALEVETGQATGYQQTGGVWLAQRPERMIELERIRAMGDRSGLATRILGAAEIRERLPFLQTDDLAGGLWVEQDGQVNPVDLCMAYARGAKASGVEIREHGRVVDIEVEQGKVAALELADGSRIECNKLVLCAGAWSRQLGAMAGVDIPLAACEHIYVVTDVVEQLPRPCPIIRDLDGGIYLKGDNGKLVLGAFEANPRPWTPGQQDAGFLMFDEDWDHVQPMLDAGIQRLPLIAAQGITHFMNGPESFTPDTRQIMGAAPRCRNLFVAAGFNSIGIMSSAGVGKVMAQWIRDNEPPLDLWEVDIARLDPLQNGDAYLAERLPEAVHNQFAMHWPYQQYQTGRDLRRSPWHELMSRQGAVFGAPTGWERPLWFAAGEHESGLRYSHGAQHWWPAARREALHCQRQASLFELSPFTKFDIVGRDAMKFLQRVCCSDMDIEPGCVRYTLMLNRRGGIEAEITVARLAGDRFRLVSGAATRFKDLDWLQRHCDPGDAVEIVDVTEAFAVVGVMGPESRNLLQELTASELGDEAFPFSSARAIHVDGCEVLATRLSFVGELGWELYIPAPSAPRLLEGLLAAGAGHDLGMAGHFALDACRIEVGFPHWGHDIGPEDTPFEAGLGFTVSLDRPDDFIGREALLAQHRDGWDKRLRLCEVDGEEVLLLHDEPVYYGDRIVGHCTSGGQGFRTGKVLCFVMFYRDQAIDHANCLIEVAGERFPLAVLEKPPYHAFHK